MAILARRECFYDHIDDQAYCTTAWSDWGRWVALAVIVGAAFLIFFLLACYNARRRRRSGLRPYYGTAWISGPQGPPPEGQQGYYYQPPPQYTPNPPSYGYYGGPPNQGYFGGQQPGIELQPPPNVHRAGEPVYSPPPGPPPAKA
ncbi:hypothetical protein VTN00DRAFT_4787 [Thermoascus crustaceus]|uniref:uncharacterized protein n=1 Tax=Thermoascus crustaceus TaxID=5088 RepID=UPI003743F577